MLIVEKDPNHTQSLVKQMLMLGLSRSSRLPVRADLRRRRSAILI